MRRRTVALQAVLAAVAVALALAAAGADLGWYERHVFPSYCAVGRAGRLAPSLVRALAWALALLLGVAARARLARRLARARRGRVAAIVLAVAAAALVSDAWLRRQPFGDRSPVERRADMPPAVPDARLGWRFLPSRKVSFPIGGGVVEYAIDGDGNRARSPEARVDRARPTLVLAGESIAFGEALAFDDTLAAALERRLGLAVVNLGVPAYGSAQVAARVADALDRLEAPVAVVITFVPQQIRREAARRRLGLSRLWRDEPYHGDDALERTRAALADTAARSRAHGATPLFVVTNFGAPCQDGAGAFVVRELFAALPHVYVELGDDDRVGACDPHPNARGANKLADAVAARLAARRAAN